MLNANKARYQIFLQTTYTLDFSFYAVQISVGIKAKYTLVGAETLLRSEINKGEKPRHSSYLCAHDQKNARNLYIHTRTNLDDFVKSSDDRQGGETLGVAVK